MELPDNRMAAPLRRTGRPPKSVIEARPPAQPVEEVEIPLPPVKGIRCLKCGRGMVPRVVRSDPKRRDVFCSLCGCRMQIRYPEKTVQLM